MENIGLFFVSVIGYLTIWEVWVMYIDFKNKNLKKDLNFKAFFGKIFILAILCAPFNVNGNVYTIAGNATGKNVYSIFSVYQEADDTALTVLSIAGYQRANRAIVMAGVVGYQDADDTAAVLIGLADYQKANNDAAVVIGVAGYQDADDTAAVVIGLAGYQKAYNTIVVIGVGGCQVATNDALVPLGIAGYQWSEHGSGALLALYQKSNNCVAAILALYQGAGKRAKTMVFTFYQRVGNTARSFVTFSENYADEAEKLK